MNKLPPMGVIVLVRLYVGELVTYVFVAMKTLNTPGTITVCTCADGSVPSLFVKFGSNVSAKADATFVKKPNMDAVFVKMKSNGSDVDDKMFVELNADGVTVTVKLVACPFVNVAIIGQVTTPLENTPLPDALAKTKFVGNTSCASVLIAGEGPALVTTIV